MADVKGVEQLKEHLERAKEHLSSTNETIKKYTGREPGTQRIFRKFDSEAAGRRLLTNALKRGISSNSADDGPISKTSRPGDASGRVVNVAYSRVETRRRERDIYDRLGPAPRLSVRRRDEEDTRRRPLTISSSITRHVREDTYEEEEPKPDRISKRLGTSVVRVAEQRSREDAIKEMKSVDPADKERNRRIFSGLLLSTLRNFNSQATHADEVAKKRRNVEARIDEREAEKEEDLRRERADLYRARRDNQRMVWRIEQKIRSVDAFEAWKKEIEKQKFFIRTRARPHIYYLPRVMDSVSERRKARTAKEVDSLIAERRAKMEEEVAQLIEEEPQDPNQLLEETNRSRSQQQAKEETKDEPQQAESSVMDFDELAASNLQEPTVGVEEEEEEVEVVEEEIPLPPSPAPKPIASKSEDDGEKDDN